MIRGKLVTSDYIPCGNDAIDDQGLIHFSSGVDWIKISESVMPIRGWIVEPWNVSTEQELPRHVSRLKDWSKRRKIDSENTYCIQKIRLCTDRDRTRSYRGQCEASAAWPLQRRRGLRR